MYVVIRFIQILEGRPSIVILRFNGVLYPPASVCDMYIHTTVYSNIYYMVCGLYMRPSRAMR